MRLVCSSQTFFLKILESPNSGLQHKWMVLKLLYELCKEPKTLVDLYLNYDCDLDSTDIFERCCFTLFFSLICKGW